MHRIVPPLAALAVIVGVLWVVLTTSGRAGPVLVVLGGGHGIHLYDIVLVLGGGVAAVGIWCVLRRRLSRRKFNESR